MSTPTLQIITVPFCPSVPKPTVEDAEDDEAHATNDHRPMRPPVPKPTVEDAEDDEDGAAQTPTTSTQNVKDASPRPDVTCIDPDDPSFSPYGTSIREYFREYTPSAFILPIVNALHINAFDPMMRHSRVTVEHIASPHPLPTSLPSNRGRQIKTDIHVPSVNRVSTVELKCFSLDNVQPAGDLALLISPLLDPAIPPSIKRFLCLVEATQRSVLETLHDCTWDSPNNSGIKCRVSATTTRTQLQDVIRIR